MKRKNRMCFDFYSLKTHITKWNGTIKRQFSLRVCALAKTFVAIRKNLYILTSKINKQTK